MTDRRKTPVNCLTSVFTDCYKNVNRNVQRTEECFGHSGITTTDDDIQKMTGEISVLIKRHKRIISLVEQRLKQGPLAVTKQYIYESAERRKHVRTNEQYQLGSQLIFAGRAFGDMSLFGKILLDVGMAEQDLGHEELKFVTMTAISLLAPMRSFLATSLHNVTKQQKLLNNRRLDLDLAFRRFHQQEKSGHDSTLQLRARIDAAQVDFDSQQRHTRTAYVSALEDKKRMVIACLRFIECQLEHMRRCADITQSLKTELIHKLKAEDIPDLQWPATELNLGALNVNMVNNMNNMKAPRNGADSDNTGQDEQLAAEPVNIILPDVYDRSDGEPTEPTEPTELVEPAANANLEEDSNTRLLRKPLSMLKKTWEELKAVVHLSHAKPLEDQHSSTVEVSKQNLPTGSAEADHNADANSASAGYFPVAIVHDEEKESVVRARERRNARGPLGHQSILAEQFQPRLPEAAAEDEEPGGFQTARDSLQKPMLGTSQPAGAQREEKLSWSKTTVVNKLGSKVHFEQDAGQEEAKLPAPANARRHDSAHDRLQSAGQVPEL